MIYHSDNKDVITVFLGGTGNDSTWRDELIAILNRLQIVILPSHFVSHRGTTERIDMAVSVITFMTWISFQNILEYRFISSQDPPKFGVFPDFSKIIIALVTG